MENNGGKIAFEAEGHSNHVCKALSSMLEKQYLVDIAVVCGNHTVLVHKFVLAANSAYFKEHLQNKAIEQVLISGLDFTIMKSLIEYMYSAECVISEHHLSHFIAAVKFFKIIGLEDSFTGKEYQNLAAYEVRIPEPKFICTPPKFACKPNSAKSSTPKMNYALSNVNGQQQSFGNKVGNACAKEAEASGIALATLQKSMASSSQIHTVIVDDSHNQATVENFIPLVDDGNAENIREVHVGNRRLPEETITSDKSFNPDSLSNNEGLQSEEIEHLENNDVEYVFQTEDGNFVKFTDKSLLNLSNNPFDCQIVANAENLHVETENLNLPSDVMADNSMQLLENDNLNSEVNTSKNFDDLDNEFLYIADTDEVLPE